MRIVPVDLLPPAGHLLTYTTRVGEIVTNTQLHLSIGIPTLMVLTGLFLNWSATRELASRFAVFESDMRQF